MKFSCGQQLSKNFVDEVIFQACFLVSIQIDDQILCLKGVATSHLCF